MNIVLFGGTGSIGRAMVSNLAQQKNKLWVIGSNKDKLRNLKEKYGVSTVLADLATVSGIKCAVEAIAKISQVDLILFNQGIYEPNKVNDSDGYDINLMVNAFSSYYITKELLSYLKTWNTKIVVTSSISIRKAKGIMEVQKLKNIYRETKLLQYQLLSLLNKHCEIVFAHPGITPSKISYQLHGKLVGFFLSFFATKPDKACKSILCAVSEEVPLSHWVCPRFLGLFGKPTIKKIKVKKTISKEINLKIKSIEQEFKYGI